MIYLVIYAYFLKDMVFWSVLFAVVVEFVVVVVSIVVGVLEFKIKYGIFVFQFR